MVATYVHWLEALLAVLAPLFIGYRALQRFMRSRSFNRFLYGFTIVHCLFCLMALWIGMEGAALDRALAHGIAYTPLVLWAYIVYASPSTRGLRHYGDPEIPRTPDRRGT